MFEAQSYRHIDRQINRQIPWRRIGQYALVLAMMPVLSGCDNPVSRFFSAGWRAANGNNVPGQTRPAGARITPADCKSKSGDVGEGVLQGVQDGDTFYAAGVGFENEGGELQIQDETDTAYAHFHGLNSLVIGTLGSATLTVTLTGGSAHVQMNCGHDQWASAELSPIAGNERKTAVGTLYNVRQGMAVVVSGVEMVIGEDGRLKATETEKMRNTASRGFNRGAFETDNRATVVEYNGTNLNVTQTSPIP